MKVKYKAEFKNDSEDGFVVLSLKIIPETEEEREFLKNWDEDQYIEKWIDNKGNLRLLI